MLYVCLDGCIEQDRSLGYGNVGSDGLAAAFCGYGELVTGLELFRI